jgi:hypothetical protein
MAPHQDTTVEVRTPGSSSTGVRVCMALAIRLTEPVYNTVLTNAFEPTFVGLAVFW